MNNPLYQTVAKFDKNPFEKVLKSLAVSGLP
jgi:hypothetical protein